MKVLSVLNPILDDYNESGVSNLAINLGNVINKADNNIEVDFVGNNILYKYKMNRKIYVPDNINRSRYIKDTISYVVDIFNEYKYDVLHIHISQMSVLNSILTIIPDHIPVIYTQHTSTISGRGSLGYADSARELSQSSSKNVKIVCPSNSMVNIWSKYIKSDKLDNVIMIRNGINTYSDIQIQEQDDRTDKYISCARIEDNKGMLDVAHTLKYTDKRGILVGDYIVGNLYKTSSSDIYYKNFLDTLTNKIDYHKTLSNHDVVKLMSTSKGYISMANIESFGLVIAEAMSVGTPILYLEESAISELVDNSMSMMIPKSEIYRKHRNNRTAILSNYLLEFDRLIYSKDITTDNTLKRFRNMKLTIEDCAENYINLYNTMLG